MKKSILLFFCVFSFCVLFGQSENYNFGKVPQEQLEMTTYEKDTSAAAVILHDYGDLTIRYKSSSYKQIFSRCRRIKIMKKGGLSYGDLNIEYYSYKDTEGIGELKAVVTLPSRQMYTFTKDDFFTEKEGKYWSSKKIALPHLEVGTVIDYYYEIISERVIVPHEWYFQEDIPIVISELNIYFAPLLSYIYLFQGFEGMKKENFESMKQEGFIATKQGGEKVTILRDSITTAILEPFKFTLTNVPALKEEPFITTIDDYRLRIRFQCTHYTEVSGVVTEILSDWSRINIKLHDHYLFGHQFSRAIYHNKIAKAAAPILEKKQARLKKAIELYDFINTNVELNRISSIYVQKSLNDAFEKKRASKSEMNLMLLALLRKAGIEAYPLLISTRDNGFPMPDHSIVDQFDRVILYAIIDGKKYFIESGNQLRPFGELSINSMNREGYLLRKSDDKWIKITPNKSKKIIMSDFALNNKGEITGKISANYTKSLAYIKRADWLTKNNEKLWVEWLEKNVLDFELDSVTVENLEEVDKPFKVHLNGDFSGAAQAVGDFVYINPFILSDFTENPFKSEKRQYPVDFPDPFSTQSIINIKYDAEVYQIEQLPEDAQLALPEKMVSLRYAAQEKAPGWIQITYKLSVDKPYLPANIYSGLRTLFDITAEKLGEPIVLKKL